MPRSESERGLVDWWWIRIWCRWWWPRWIIGRPFQDPRVIPAQPLVGFGVIVGLIFGVPVGVGIG